MGYLDGGIRSAFQDGYHQQGAGVSQPPAVQGEPGIVGWIVNSIISRLGDKWLNTLIDMRMFDRESFEGIGLESKLDLFPGPEVGKWSLLNAGENVPLPPGYARDRFHRVSHCVIELYGGWVWKGRGGEYNLRFSIVHDGEKASIKEKREPQLIEKGDIVLFERPEREYRGFSPEQVNGFIDHAKCRPGISSLDLLGSFTGHHEESFVMNRETGRIFVVDVQECTIGPGRAYNVQNVRGIRSMTQLEVKYFGRLLRYPVQCQADVYDDLASLTERIRKNLPELGLKGKPSLLTKFEWVMSFAKS